MIVVRDVVIGVCMEVLRSEVISGILLLVVVATGGIFKGELLLEGALIEALVLEVLLEIVSAILVIIALLETMKLVETAVVLGVLLVPLGDVV